MKSNLKDGIVTFTAENLWDAERLKWLAKETGNPRVVSKDQPNFEISRERLSGIDQSRFEAAR